MATSAATRFLAGVIEGFYGPPWGQAERFAWFDRMAAWGLNTYFYCPKDDLKQRALWREPYSATEAESLREVIEACRRRDLLFVYALSPGLDIRYGDATDATRLRERFEQMIALGCGHFALLFDDIPDQLDPSELARWGSLAGAQSRVANDLFGWVRERLPDARFLFCPTPYCGRMARAGLGGPDYLPTIGERLHPGIDILWTGPEIISREITVEHVREVGAMLRRKPLIWDNLHANDYDGRRFFCGPYSGRPRELREAVSGLLTNPNCESPLDYVPIRTLADFVTGDGPWDPRQAYLSALREWSVQFETCLGPSLAFDDLVLLGDCYYLPYEDGPEAGELYRLARHLLARRADTWGSELARFRATAGRLRNVCARMAELKNRPLFYALGRRVWELREEMDLMLRYVDLKSTAADPDAPVGSDFHLPETYRGGFVARWQSLLEQRSNGDFVPSPTPADSRP